MFASALQKRKAVVALSQLQPQAVTQTHASSLSSQPQQHAPVSAAASTRDSTATAARPSLSDMLAKKQRTEPHTAPQSSALTTARNWKNSSKPPQQQRLHEKQSEKAATTQKRPASAKNKAAPASTKARQLQRESEHGDEQEGVVFELSTKRRVTVRKWRAAVLIDIREYYDDDGVSKPGKKGEVLLVCTVRRCGRADSLACPGISLAKDQWRALQGLAPAIDEAIILVEDDSVDEHSLEHVDERIAADSTERTISFTVRTLRVSVARGGRHRHSHACGSSSCRRRLS